MVRFVDSEGDPDAGDAGDGLAPVIPLFGERPARAYPKTADEVRQSLDERVPAAKGPDAAPGHRRTDEAGVGRADWAEAARSGHPGWADDAGPGRAGDVRAGHASWAGAAEADGPRSSGRRRGRPDRGGGAGDPSDVDAAEAAERGLIKKLRARELSVSEAKSYLVQQDLEPDVVDSILFAFIDRGYLDDARAAEQIVHAGSDRKGQGRQAIAQTLAKRGIPRDIADAALAELPDDDFERALEFARSKAGSMRSLERDVALRRLAGQLARRGYGGSLALTAARTALDEAARPVGRVRFEER